MINKIQTLLGFAQRAGKLISGENGCVSSIKKGKVFLVIIAADASQNTKSLFNSLCSSHKILCLEWGSKNDLGTAIGKSPRATVAIIDKHFAEQIAKLT